MVPQSEFRESTYPGRVLELWMLPIAATILVAGALLLRIGVPMVELAVQPPKQTPAPIVIWLPAAAAMATEPAQPQSKSNSLPRVSEGQAHVATD